MAMEASAEAPEWLTKLEERREKLKRKLGHESGAGSPCNECGDKCPGLDLHFWRKVCRNCKCRKDQHLCEDDDSGWAQFEILGQIRSKPAYIKIKALAEPIKLDWIPPNTSSDIVHDYLEKLGEKRIPIHGSDAAVKRKQQLEFQVPPHDLDDKFCDNLSEAEANQLKQYVQKIRENCVGQGNVIRVGSLINYDAKVDYVSEPHKNILEQLEEAPATIVTDKFLIQFLNSENLANALLNSNSKPINLTVFPEPLIPDTNFDATGRMLSYQTKQRIKPFPMAAVTSLVVNGPFYDKLLSKLSQKNICFNDDPVLKPVLDFRNDFLTDNNFKQELNELVSTVAPYNINVKGFNTPLKAKLTDNILNSPLHLRNPIQTYSGSLVNQETPMRKIKFDNKASVMELLGLPIECKIEKDKIFHKIVNSEDLKNSLQNPSVNGKLILSSIPVIPDFEFVTPLSESIQMKLDRIGLNNKDCIQSCFVNGPLYDKLLNGLKSKQINFAECKLLQPISDFRIELLNDPQFQKEISKIINRAPPNDISIYDQLSYGVVKSSNSSDSGFIDPPTPNYSTFPNIADGKKMQPYDAQEGKYMSIPGIENFNMYPNVELPTSDQSEQREMESILKEMRIDDSPNPVSVLNCRDCNEPIFAGEVAVRADRAVKEIGNNVAWHPECFKCHKCRELLADLVYFFHGGNVYCGRDLALILKIPRCFACDELIFTKEYTAAENSTYHIKHFCCFHCDTPLAGKKYIPDEKSNTPICLVCYDEYCAEKCAKCSSIIGPTEQGVSWGKIHWHSNCFKCSNLSCTIDLIGKKFCIKENVPFCSAQCVSTYLNR